MTRRLGYKQKIVLTLLDKRGAWYRHPDPPWVLGAPSATESVLRSLVSRGFARQLVNGSYMITQTGQQALK